MAVTAPDRRQGRGGENVQSGEDEAPPVSSPPGCKGQAGASERERHTLPAGHLGMHRALSLSLRFYLFIFRERGREKERVRNIHV